MALLVLTDRTGTEGRSLVDVVAAAVDGGARTVVLREKDLPDADRSRLADELLAVLAPVGGELIVAGDAALAADVGAAGVHLAATAPAVRFGRTGRSCHSVVELKAAVADAMDYATYSPVWTTASKPGYGPALGRDGLATGCAAVPELAVYALGGVEPGRVAACRDAGAAGIAVMGGIMRAKDPAAVVRTLLEEWTT